MMQLETCAVSRVSFFSRISRLHRLSSCLVEPSRVVSSLLSTRLAEVCSSYIAIHLCDKRKRRVTRSMRYPTRLPVEYILARMK